MSSFLIVDVNSLSYSCANLFRPSLFDDFVEYELDRLKKLEQQLDEDDSNNNLKTHLDDEQQLSSSNTLHAN